MSSLFGGWSFQEPLVSNVNGLQGALQAAEVDVWMTAGIQTALNQIGVGLCGCCVVSPWHPELSSCRALDSLRPRVGNPSSVRDVRPLNNTDLPPEWTCQISLDDRHLFVNRVSGDRGLFTASIFFCFTDLIDLQLLRKTASITLLFYQPNKLFHMFFFYLTISWWKNTCSSLPVIHIFQAAALRLFWTQHSCPKSSLDHNMVYYFFFSSSRSHSFSADSVPCFLTKAVVKLQLYYYYYCCCCCFFSLHGCGRLCSVCCDFISYTFNSSCSHWLRSQIINSIIVKNILVHVHCIFTWQWAWCKLTYFNRNTFIL